MSQSATVLKLPRSVRASETSAPPADKLAALEAEIDSAVEAFGNAQIGTQQTTRRLIAGVTAFAVAVEADPASRDAFFARAEREGRKRPAKGANPFLAYYYSKLPRAVLDDRDTAKAISDCAKATAGLVKAFCPSTSMRLLQGW